MIRRDYNVIKIAQIEQICKKNFNVDLRVENVLFDDVQTGVSSYTTIFQAGKNAMYALFESEDTMTLSDIKRIAKSMGIEAESYFAPYDDQNYFSRHGHQAFLRAYPGRKTETAQEKDYYETLSPYSPALIKISKINGEIRRYNYNSVVPSWQIVFEYSYTRIRVQ